MALTNLKTLSTDNKLLVLRCSASLQQLEIWLSEGHSLSHVAKEFLDLDPRMLYRWIARYSDLAEVVALYKPVKSDEPVLDLSRPAAYRILCAYEDHGTYIKGAIHSEWETPQKLWDSPYMRDYFNFWGIDGSEYRTQYPR